MNKRALVSAVALSLTGTLGLASPSSASSAEITAEWMSSRAGCTVTVTSDKDISNIAYLVDGEEVRHEFEDGMMTYTVVGVSGVWVKSGNNHSGDGSGLGEFFDGPIECERRWRRQRRRRR